MRKIYLNDKPIICSDEPIYSTSYNLFVYKSKNTITETLHKLRHTNTNGIIIYHNNFDELWHDFTSFFNIVEAAGGVVKYNENNWLFIRRNNHWDLPKGRIENNETPEITAIREVQEECGIKNLKLTDFLTETYHIYTERKRQKLKKTYWYGMILNEMEQPSPQLEEGITEAVFVKENNIPKMYNSMYQNVKNIVTTYIKP